MCTNPANVVQVTENIFLCAVKGIANFDIGSQLFLLEGIVTEVLQRFGFGPLVNAIYSLCKSVGGMVGAVSKAGKTLFGGIFEPIIDVATAVLPLGDCTGLTVAGEVMCGAPVVLRFPSEFNIGRCLNTTASTCVGTHPNKALVVQQFFQTVTCVFTSIIAAPGVPVTSLFCTVVKVMVQILSTGPLNVVGSVLKELKNVVRMQCENTRLWQRHPFKKLAIPQGCREGDVGVEICEAIAGYEDVLKDLELYEVPCKQVSGIDEPFAIEELEADLATCRRYSSPGPANITYAAIRPLDHEAQEILLRHVNVSWRDGVVPSAWK
ncbi:uncharacterized protein LOC142591510 [Dermacentor variabilis]|uniref:uncharacterized protein LOC142591510 n=1 Tax=Dermacentor variabilis TaxID=34621 RepID=UPI003F5B5DCB